MEVSKAIAFQVAVCDRIHTQRRAIAFRLYFLKQLERVRLDKPDFVLKLMTFSDVVELVKNLFLMETAIQEQVRKLEQKRKNRSSDTNDLMRWLNHPLTFPE